MNGPSPRRGGAGAAILLLAALAGPALSGLALPGFALAGPASSGAARASVPDSSASSPPPHTGALVQVWWTVLEEAENGVLQSITGDEAARSASGFSIRRARLQFDFRRGRLDGRISLRLEGSPPGLLDAHAGFPVLGPALGLRIGQMKIPCAYEVATEPAELDFATTSRFAALVGDFSLSRSPSLQSPRFNGVRTWDRDLGVAAAGETGGLRYALMVGNGLGANRFVGSVERKQEVLTNRPGAHLYAARAAWTPVGGGEGRGSTGSPVTLRVGGHVARNHHPDILLDDGRTVVDLDRSSWSADLHGELARRFRLTAMAGGGLVDDDVDGDGVTDYTYRGWEVKGLARFASGRVEAGVRYDEFTEEYAGNGREDIRRAWTLGASARPAPGVRLMLNWTLRSLDSPTDVDVDDDVLLVAAQIVL